MNLQPLKITAPDDSATGSIYIRCRATGAIKTWNEAARDGWAADLNGKPFRDYYSPEGARIRHLLPAREVTT